MSNEEVSDTYRHRWQVEVLWKFLKMRLNLDKLITKNVNGVTIQIYMILIAYLILLLIGIPAFYGSKLLDKFRYLQLELSRRCSIVYSRLCIGATICCQRRLFDSCALNVKFHIWIQHFWVKRSQIVQRVPLWGIAAIGHSPHTKRGQF